jgi:putative cell wall-binding protein
VKPRALIAVSTVGAVAMAMLSVSPSRAATVLASDLPGMLAVRAEDTTHSYDRDRFQHWIDADSNGCNTRYEVLIQESTSPVSIGAGCSLSGGNWISLFDGGIATTPAGIEIDHLVALAEAWRSGAWGWSDAMRKDFANDLGVTYALNAATSAANQSKADKDPAEWLPSNSAYECEYVTSWALVKYRWSLTVDSVELAALQAILAGDCGAVAVTVPTVLASLTPEPPPGSTVIAAFPSGTTRLQGSDRYLTAVATSQRYSPGVPVVFVATGTNFPDALSAAAAAANLGGPLLLTNPSVLPPEVAAELDRLNPLQIYVIGGTGAVSESVVGSISLYGPVERLGGADRYATGFNITSTAFTATTMVVVATGRNFPDALAATGLAGAHAAPVVLVDGNAGSVPSTIANLISSLGPTSIVIAGGTGAVSSGIASQLASIAPVTRYAGQDRYSTAAAINDAGFSSGSTPVMFLATGENFPDALAGAALAGRLGAPLYITQKSCVPTAIHESIENLSPSAVVVLGGTGAVSNAAASNIDCAPPPPPPPTPPANPGNTKNCGDFATWSQAQSWFWYYYPYYGDVALLDGDEDLIACESLPGAP